MRRDADLLGELPAEEAERKRGRGLGPIIWLVIIVAYLLLQVIGGLNGESP